LIKKLQLFFSLACFSLMVSCSYTRYVPDGQKLLVKNKVQIEGDEEKVPGTEGIIKQKPNKSNLRLVKLDLLIYNLGSGKPDNFFSRIGEAPVIINPAKTASSAKQIQDYYFNHGYFNAKTSYEVINDDKKASVVYSVNPGKRYYLRNYSTDIKTSTLERIEFSNSKDRLPEEGKPYDAEVLDKERERLIQIYRNSGYYGFPKSYITFLADTLIHGDSVDVTMIVAQKPIRVNDSISYRDHERYRINNIFIRPDHDYSSADQPSDTLDALGYTLVYDTLKYKPRYFADAIHFKKNDTYRQRDVKDTYSHLAGYKAFQITEVNFKEVGRDSTGPLLDAYVRLFPQPKRTFTIEFEGTTASGNYGINLNVGVVNRNLFGAGEALQFKINNGLEFQATTVNERLARTYDVGVELGMEFPRFLLPFNTIGLLPKRMQPKSRVSLSANRLSRAEFQRETFNAKLSYFWKETRLKTHQVDLLDLSYSNIFNVSPSFLNDFSEVQLLAFQPEFIGASKYTFTYNEQVNPEKLNYNFFRGSLEIAGNSLSLIDNSFSIEGTNQLGQDVLLDVLYYQFLKIETDYRYYWNLSDNSSWINRVFMGYIIPYGNSQVSDSSGTYGIPPFSRAFFMGGSNDLRAWPAYRLGAGTQANTNYSDGSNPNFAIGTFKLLINSEYRFPLVSFLKGAFFVDIGNIWLTGGLENLDSQTALKISNFVDELAIGSGFGLRLDFNFFVVRFDVGIKVRDPGRLDINNGWVVDKIRPNTLTYNIALGYPF